MRALQEAFRFFHEHAFYAVDHRATGAIALARAELRARELGLAFGWEYEQESYEDVYGEPLPDGVEGPYFVACFEPCESVGYECAARRCARCRVPLASLSMVTLASSRDPYRRVVEAELALEALDELERRASCEKHEDCKACAELGRACYLQTKKAG